MSGKTPWTFQKGLHQTGNGTYAYLQPDGGWGWSNAGLIVDSGQSLLVDTLFDASLTRDMLTTMQDAAGVRAEDIGVVVNTHANGDHTHGNGLCCNAEIIASESSKAEMAEFPPEMLAELMEAAPAMGLLGTYLLDIFGQFNFRDVAEKLPTKTFCGRHDLMVGNKTVELHEVGPAHTAGDVIAHVPGERTVYTGDILFIDGTPIMWAGPVSNWIKACDKIIALDPEVIVPGHGPITDLAGVRRVQDYLRYIAAEARKRYDAGLGVRDAAHDIALSDFDSWLDAERIAVNVSTLYREFAGEENNDLDVPALFGLMAEIRQSRRS
ncbi:MBL fold metallo-hydrolase [Eilatimonas milleporae]|uniref:Glyoxylase-like metal-dependent hydrolase (Beta-lactamase superfamily II) n=1 Tax=Eilatimonas milleporae TaxID=911205 RepID=A0A3M0CGX8_9PROT|nr:MBL fold metallo-hydrolase [Eilatimonas milleporae]RMB08205.1 glyoxylase-like metal-dependent hydrolase (beta-lactamase superfamily II) [Eilatimonas milleporae]